MPLPPEQEASYSAIIDEILATSDLNTVSAKRIRKGLQAKVDYDLQSQKDEITELIMQRFDKFNSTQAAEKPPVEPAPTAKPPTTNGIKSEHSRDEEMNGNGHIAETIETPHKKRPNVEPPVEDESGLSEPADSPPPKKHKKSQSEDDDAAFAARLQAEEDRAARSTRGGGSARKRAPAKQPGKKKKKSKDTVDDSDLEDGAVEKKKREVNRTGGFHKPLQLSPSLAELLGEQKLPRTQVVKKIWDYIKANDLQEPQDKRQIKCDDNLRKVFKQEKVHMFTMNKLLGPHLYAIDE